MTSLTDTLAHFLNAGSENQSILQAFAGIGIAYLGGMAASLTPCVYPMIPITVSVVGGLTPGSKTRRSWQEMLLRAGTYLAGMMVVYSFLGVLAGLTGRVFGSYTNSSGWYIALGIIMSVSALLMMDIVYFDPMAWIERIKRKIRHISGRPHPIHSNTAHKEMTLIGAFSLGASSGLIAAPCTTPVLTAILAYIAKTQSVGMGMILMLSFSMGLGTLLLVIAAFTGALQLLPKSGNWMKTIKILSGILLLMFSQYLFYRAGALGGVTP